MNINDIKLHIGSFMQDSQKNELIAMNINNNALIDKIRTLDPSFSLESHLLMLQRKKQQEDDLKKSIAYKIWLILTGESWTIELSSALQFADINQYPMLSICATEDKVEKIAAILESNPSQLNIRAKGSGLRFFTGDHVVNIANTLVMLDKQHTRNLNPIDAFTPAKYIGN